MFAIVEIMGHRTRAGRISDATIGGATLLRIEHPTVADETGAEPLTEYYAPPAVFMIRPCSEDEAKRVAVTHWATEFRQQLSAPFAELVEPDYDDDYPI